MTNKREFDYVLFLDDERYPTNPNDIIVRNFDDARWIVENLGVPSHICFDHDLGHKKLTGMDFAKWFVSYVMDNGYDPVEFGALFSFSVHSQNPVGAENIRSYMQQFLDNFCVD